MKILHIVSKNKWPLITQERDTFYIESPTILTSTISYWYLAGSRYSPKEGLPHLIEHLVFQNHSTHRNSKDLIRRETLGIESNAFTGSEFCYFYHNQLPSALNDSTKLLKKIIQHPYFSEELLRKEKNAVIQEQNNTPATDKIWRLSLKALFNKEDVANDVFGTPQSIKSITANDCNNFYKKNYNEPYIFCALPQSTLDLKNNQILTLKNNPVKIQKEINKTTPRIHINSLESQTLISISFRASSAHEINRRIATAILRDTLSNYWSSRCNYELRTTKGLVYWVSGSMETFSDTGILSINTSCKPKDAAHVIRYILKQCDDLTKNLISHDELKKAIAAITFNTLSQMQNPYTLTTWYAPEIITRTGLTMETYIKNLEQITRQEIQMVAKELFDTENRSIVTMGA